METLDAQAIRTSLRAIPGWSRERKTLRRTYEFPDFVVAMKFVNAVAKAAEKAQHHPDMDIRWNRVTLSLTTHDVGGLTDLDFQLAMHCDRLAVRHWGQVHSR